MDATELSAYSVQHNPWHAAMYNKSTAQTMATGGFVQATMDTVLFDPSSMCTLGAAAGKFTIQQDGVYVIAGAISMTSVADGERFIVSLYKSGAELVRGVDFAPGAAATLTYSVATTQYLKSGDTIDIRGQNFTTSRAVYIGGVSQVFTYLTICYLGPA